MGQHYGWGILGLHNSTKEFQQITGDIIAKSKILIKQNIQISDFISLVYDIAEYIPQTACGWTTQFNYNYWFNFTQ